MTHNDIVHKSFILEIVIVNSYLYALALKYLVSPKEIKKFF